MAFKRKYKFSIIDHLYYAGHIRRIHNRWFMPLEAVCFFIFGFFPPFLFLIFLAEALPMWLSMVLFVGSFWGEVELYSRIEKEHFTKAREQAYYRRYPERKDKNYFWLQLLLPLGLFLINLGIAYWLFFVYQ